MATQNLIELKITDIKTKAFNKVKAKELETIPYTKAKIKGENGIQFKHIQNIENLIFHFTKSSNLEYILNDRTLLLNSSENMTDPIENKWYFEEVGTGYHVNRLMRKNVRFCCFCKPFLEIGDNKIPAYALSRMWNQYGGNYDGCCIGFNKKKLEEIFKKQYPSSSRIGEIRYDLPLDPEFGVSVTHTVTTTPSTLKIYEDGYGTYKQWDDSMAKELYLSTDMFGFLFRKAFDYRDENEIRFSIYDSSESPRFIHDIDSAIELIIFGYKIDSEKAFEYDLQTQATVYRLYFESPYRLVNNAINQHWTKGYGRLEKITTSETMFLKRYNSMKDRLSNDDKYIPNFKNNIQNKSSSDDLDINKNQTIKTLQPLTDVLNARFFYVVLPSAFFVD